ncbi:MAG TPA: penicillin-binding protein 2 [Candidatus Wolfebacteria bacterium]|nr:penicillin-binding protein 2 [Candidatus Wolfebacteria bacterium]
MKKKELFLEEAVLDDLAQDLDVLELPLSRRAFKLVGLAIIIVIVIVIVRVFYLGVWQGDFYKSRAQINTNQIIPLRAERGIIFDRFNKPFVENLPVFRLSLMVVELLKSQKEREQTLKILNDIIGLPLGKIDSLIREVNLEKQNSITLAKNLTIEQVIKLKNLNLKSIRIEENFERQYYNPKINAHFLGYTGIVSKNDLYNNPEFSINDILGKVGLESYYDKELRGKDGQRASFRDAKGKIIDEKLLTEPIAGVNLYLTIDAEFQSYFYQRLKQGLSVLGRWSGVGIALNPQNGEILALVSLPSFDANNDLSEFLSDPNKPFFNRAISGVYAPGSTIKPLVALAALEEDVITPTQTIFSPGFLEIPNPYHPEQPSRFLDWKAHGWVNLYSAIARSSNVYFYTIGGGLPNNEFRGIGIEKLKEYWEKFGFGEKTGIDLPGENQGFLPDPEEKEQRTGEIWRVGDTYNVSIGQGDLLVTPLQLINYIAMIANNGKIFRPFIVKKVISEDGVIEKIQPYVLKNYTEFAEHIKEVQKGMIDVVKKSYGTANFLSDLPISVAAKTGTAQIQGNTKINALFVGYLPAEALMKMGASLDKQIAILVLIENAREDRLNVTPIAKDVFEWYYYNRLK